MGVLATLRLPILCVALLATPASACASSNTISTFAGTGAASSTGDGGPAIAATFNGAYAIARTGDGSMLVAEYVGNRVRRISPAGVMSTIAGNGTASSTGDGGQATSATVKGPVSVAVAPDGVTIYITEYDGHRIRKINAAGVISTVAGTGTQGFSGDGGAAGSAQLRFPQQVDPATNGDLYVADYVNHRVRKIGHDAGLTTVSGSSTITTVVGSGAASSSGDGGAATSATVNGPTGVHVNSDGSFAVTEYGGRRVRLVNSSGVISTIAGTGSACTATNKCGDGGLATSATTGNLLYIHSDGAGGYLFADYGANRVRRINVSGVISTVIGSGTACTTATDVCGDGGRAEVAAISLPSDVIVDADGTIYTNANNRIRARALNPTGTGPAGAAGAAGAAGPDGPGGSTGPDGLPGATGADGMAGATGATGATGGAGPTGPDGVDGPAGITGAMGTTGAAGSAGPAGAQGQAGPDGAAGIVGPDGSRGLPGRDGAAGSGGLAGPDGSDGRDAADRSASGPRSTNRPTTRRDVDDRRIVSSPYPLMIMLPSAVMISRPARHTYVRIFVTGGSTVELRLSARGKVVKALIRTFKRVGRKRFDLRAVPRGTYTVSVVATQFGTISRARTTLVVR